MSSIFLSHTGIDKPFVEKLAKDLKRLGLNVWFDKWEIKVGESLMWKIEEGIRANEYLGIILSPEALRSEWVKSELGAGWVKQIQLKKVFVLPIYYRDCEIPYLLADRKYADFRNDYQSGLDELAGVFGIKETKKISIENWRMFPKNKTGEWMKYKTEEFELLVTSLVDHAIDYNWSVYTGGTANEFSVSLSGRVKGVHKEISIKLASNNSYMASSTPTYNPNHLKAKDFDIYVGASMEACEEYVWRIMEDFTVKYGISEGTASYHTHRFSRKGEIEEAARKMMKKFNWYKGDKLL